MFCTNCGFEISDPKKFCTNCGFELALSDVSQNKSSNKIGKSDVFLKRVSKILVKIFRFIFVGAIAWITSIILPF